MTAWLPLITSLIIASVTIFGIMLNNRTNARAIIAADARNQTTIQAALHNTELTNTATTEREHEKWRRDALLAIVATVIDDFSDIQRVLAGPEKWSFADETERDTFFDELRERLRAANSSLYKLQILADRAVATRFEQSRDKLGRAIDHSQMLARAMADRDQNGEDPRGMNEVQREQRRALELYGQPYPGLIEAARNDLYGPRTR